MKKNICVILGLLLSAFFVSCPVPDDNNDDPIPTPVITASPTAVPTPVSTGISQAGVNIDAVLQRIDSGACSIQYSVVVLKDGNPCTTATITLDRPNGQVSIAETGNGTYHWTSNDSADYQPGSTYTLSVTVDGTVYTDSTIARGNITITSSQATWTNDGNTDTIYISDGGPYNFNDGPDIDSPYSFPALSDGEYFVTMVVTNNETGYFPGATSDSVFATEDAKIQTITKP